MRSFFAFPLPFLLTMAAIFSLPKDTALPAFVTQWPAMTRFFVAFVVLFSGMLLYQIVLHFWVRWIDPEGLGSRERHLSDEIDNLGFLGFLVAIMAYTLVAKELDFSFGIIGICLASWFVAVTAIATLVRRREKLARSQKDVASTSSSGE